MKRMNGQKVNMVQMKYKYHIHLVKQIFCSQTFSSSCSFTVRRSMLSKFRTFRNSSLVHNTALIWKNKSQILVRIFSLYLWHITSELCEEFTCLFSIISCRVEIPTAKIAASAFKLSFPQTTSEMLPVPSSSIKSVTFLPSRNLQPWDFRVSIHGPKIFSLTVPRQQTKSKFFCRQDY